MPITTSATKRPLVFVLSSIDSQIASLATAFRIGSVANLQQIENFPFHGAGEGMEE